MEPLSVAKLGLSLPPVKKWLANFPDPNTPKFLAAREELFREWIAETAKRVDEMHEFLSARIDGLEGAPPVPNAKSIIRISQVPGPVADVIAAKAPMRTSPVTSIGTQTDSIEIVSQSIDGVDSKELTVHGPHDVLGWLAEEIDSPWIERRFPLN